MVSDDATSTGAVRAEPSPLDTDEIPVVVVERRRPAPWSRTWGLGGIAVVLAAFQLLGGLGLLFFYRPLAAAAYVDLVDLAEASRFGYLRELHRWGAHAFVIVVALHLFRTVVTGAYRAPRSFNFQVGVILGVVVLLSAVTGYLLPWDTHAQWLIQAVSRSGLTRDGLDSADATLTAVYALHCGVLPVCGAIAIVYHLRRARRDGVGE